MVRAPLDGKSPARPYRESDLEAVYDICIRTGDNGEDATAKFDNPRLLADIYAGPYLFLEPSLAFVLADGDDRPVGYVLGTADTAGFVRAYEQKWVPRLASRYPVPLPGVSPGPSGVLGVAPGPSGVPGVPGRDAGLLSTFHHPERMLHTGLDAFPAHLHIDILPAQQGRGNGRSLIEVFMSAAALAGAPGAHVVVAQANARAHGFYLRVGFERLPIAGHGPVVFYGRPTVL